MQQHTAADTQNLIDRLDKWLQNNRPEYYAELLPGLDAAQLADFEAKLGLPLPEDLRLFYRWKNGQPHLSYPALFEGWLFMPDESVLATIQTMNELLDGGVFDKENWWNIRWLPFLECWDGDNWCLDLEGSFDGIPGQIIEFWHDSAERNILCTNFYDWLAALVLFFESDLYSDDDEVDIIFREFLDSVTPGYPIRNDAG